MSSSNDVMARTAGLLSAVCTVFREDARGVLDPELKLSSPSLLERTPLVVGGLLRTSILLEVLTLSLAGVATAPNSCCMRLDFLSFPALSVSFSFSVSVPLRLKIPIASNAESLSALGGGGGGGKPEEPREAECPKEGA